MAVLRRPVRSRPIRLFLISMFAIPLVCLTGLWVFAVSVTVPEADSDHSFNVSTAAVDTHGRELAVELPTERAETYLWLLSGRRSSEAPLLATRELVTRAIPPATTDTTEKSSRASTATPTVRLSGQRRPASSRVAPLIGAVNSRARGWPGHRPGLRR